MKHALLVSEFLSTPWALHPAALAKFCAVMRRWSAGIQPSDEVVASIALDRQARSAKHQASVGTSGGGIAVLPLYGIITQRGNMVDDVSGPGSCSMQQFTQALRAALSDPMVGQILIDIDSPGGSVAGVPELADEIFRSRAIKPIIGIANSLAASAAYWIGAACSELYCTKSGQVGSIGVYTAHADMSKALEDDGISMSLISAGKYKTEGNPYGPLTDEARAAIQQAVDGYYVMFTQAVSRGRGAGVSIAQVRDGMGQGRCLPALDALAENMIDGVASFDDIVAKMQKSMRSNRSASAIIEMPELVAEVAAEVLAEVSDVVTAVASEVAPAVAIEVVEENLEAAAMVTQDVADASGSAPDAPTNRLNARKNDLALLY